MATRSRYRSKCLRSGGSVPQPRVSGTSAIDELLSSGFDRAELSLLASEDAVATKLGGYYRPAGELADDPAVPARCIRFDRSDRRCRGRVDRRPRLCRCDLRDRRGRHVGRRTWRGRRRGRARWRRRRFDRLGACALGSAITTPPIRMTKSKTAVAPWVRAWNESDEARAFEIIGKHAADTVHSRSIRDTGSTPGLLASGNPNPVRLAADCNTPKRWPDMPAIDAALNRAGRAANLRPGRSNSPGGRFDLRSGGATEPPLPQWARATQRRDA